MYDYTVRMGDKTFQILLFLKTKPGLGVLSSDLKYKSEITLELKV